MKKCLHMQLFNSFEFRGIGRQAVITNRFASRLLITLMLLVFACSACETLTDDPEAGVVIANSAQVRSSTAVVAADLMEVVRGDVVDILDSSTASDTNEMWYRVRARNDARTEGWIEARNIMPQEMLDKSRRLAEEDRDLSAQATGQLRASTNLRLTPNRNDDDNILFKLESGAQFEVIGWQRVSKNEKDSDADDAPKPRTPENKKSALVNSVNQSGPGELWYKIRLNSSVSPAPAGWVYGKQVELTVPSDIIFYRTGREFVAWQRIDAPTESDSQNDQEQSSTPGSWVILERSGSLDAATANAADFDRIYVLGYNKDTREHYTAYRSPDIHGVLPLRLEASGNNKTFSVRTKRGAEPEEVRFEIRQDDRGILRIKPLDSLTTAKK